VISHAEEIEVWLKRSLKQRRTASIAYIVTSTVYLIWRLTIFNPDAPLCSFFFYLAAVLDFILGLILVFASWPHLRRTIPPLTRSYSVDVLIPVYTETVALIEFTVLAAKEIDFPHETYLLDDGNREELREVACKHGVHYLARQTNQGAKAGNLNYGMQYSKGELIAVFDADHIAQREAIEKLAGFFDDPQVAMAQAPQCFYNEDAFIYRDIHVGAGRWNEQAFFYDVSQPGRDAYNGCSGVGTCVIYRRSAVEDIGGFPPQTITEDIHTSLLFHKQGWKTVCLNEPVAWGVAAADVPEYSKTRHRWAHGNLHAVCRENVLFCKGLTWQQRVSYLCVALGLLEGWQQLLYILIPAYVMFFYVSPIQISAFNVTLVLGVPLLQILFGVAIGGGYIQFLAGQIFAIGRMHLFIAGSTGLFGRRMRWRISRKNVLGVISPSLLLPQIILAVIGCLSLIYALAREFNLVAQAPPARKVDYMVFVACAFITFNTLRSLYWIKKTIIQARYTHQEYLFEVPIPIMDENQKPLGHASRLSTTEGHAFWLEENPPQVGRVIQFLIPGHAVAAQIAKVGSDGLFSFTCSESYGQERLKRSLYSVDWHRQIRQAPLCYRPQKEGLQGPWHPAIVHRRSSDANKPFWAAIQTGKTDRQAPRLIVSESVQVGEKLVLQWFQNQQLQEAIFSAGFVIHSEYQIPKDLNDRRYWILELDET
jgi:cellulose synthase (UDP-forming)